MFPGGIGMELWLKMDLDTCKKSHLQEILASHLHSPVPKVGHRYLGVVDSWVVFFCGFFCVFIIATDCVLVKKMVENTAFFFYCKI